MKKPPQSLGERLEKFLTATKPAVVLHFPLNHEHMERFARLEAGVSVKPTSAPETWRERMNKIAKQLRESGES